jgi:KDO2-lipid IV(A) lauroyltransferase
MKQRSQQKRSNSIRRCVTLLVKALNASSRCLPYSFGVSAGGVLGRMAFFLLPRYRKYTERHLAQVFTDRDTAWVRRTARQVFVHLGKSLMEILLMKPERIPKIVEFHGADRLEEALSLGRGAVLVTGHIGNWELLGATIAMRFQLSTVAAPLKADAVNDLLLGLRSRAGFRIILRGRPGASKELIRVFKKNRILGILIDQDTDVEGAFVDFFGRPAWTPTAAVQMAIRFDAPVLYGYIRRGQDGRHTVFIEGPIALVRTGDDAKDIVNNTALLTKKIEDSVRQQPDQWVWMHRRWRRQP